MGFRDIVDQLHDQNGLANTGPTEQPNLTAFCVRAEKINNFDPGDEHLSFRGLFHERWRFLVDCAAFGVGHGSGIIYRLANHVHDAAKRSLTHRHGNRFAGIGYLLATDQPLRGVHRDGTYRVLAEVLCYLQNQAVTAIVSFQCVQDPWQVIVELNIDNRADDL